MKTKLFLLIVLFLNLVNCTGEKQPDKPLDLDNVWFSGKMINKGPQLIKGSSDNLMDTIAYYMGKEKINQLRVEYNLFVNKSGKIERMSIEESTDPTVDSIVIASIKDWRFKAGIKSEKNVNSIFPIKLYLRVNESLKTINEGEFLVSAEAMPEVIGGLHSIQTKIKYPEIAKRAGIEGKVYVLTFIDENGNVLNAKIIKGIGGGCDEAALDAVYQTKFNPGKQDGKPVKVQVTIPIMFKLD
jgi:TonB family protein